MLYLLKCLLHFLVLVAVILAIQYFIRYRFRQTRNKNEMLWRELANDFSDSFYESEADSLRSQAKEAAYSFWGILGSYPVLFEEAEGLYHNKEYYDVSDIYHDLIFNVNFIKNFPLHFVKWIKRHVYSTKLRIDEETDRRGLQ